MKTLVMDDINANIVKTLLKDARTSFTDMAKENNTSVAAIRSRYLNLKKAGIINGSILQLNLDLLGFGCYGFLQLEVDKKNVATVTDHLKTHPCILVSWVDSQRNLIDNCFAAPDLNSFRRLLTRLKGNPLIKSFHSELYEGFAFNEHPENLIIKTNKKIRLQDFKEQPLTKKNEQTAKLPVTGRFIQTPQLMQIDKIDLEIAKELSKDSRTPFSHIAKRLNISTAYVINKYNKLKKSGLIVRSSVTVNMQKLGYPAFAIVYVSIVGTKIKDIYRSIFEIPNVIVLGKIIGEWDLLGIIPLESFADLFEIERQFGTINGIDKFFIKVTPSAPAWPMNLSIAL